ncbi:MAG TPA: MFS transporter [Gaiellales bacterium]|nr:MFS transporter [Gaiellales bacterium]
MAGLRGVIVDIAPLRSSLDYRRLWVGDLLASTAHELVAVAVPFQVFLLTRSSLAVGLVGAAELVPLLLGSLAAGAVVDAHDRRRLILIAQVGAGASAALLALLASAGSPPVGAIYAVAAVIAAFASIEAPVRNASIPQLVGTHYLPPALALNQIVGQVTALAGPALAGILLATVGVTAVYWTAVAGFGVALVAVLRVRPLPPAASGVPARGWGAVREGLGFARSTPVLLSTFVIDLNAMIFGMPRALFPALAVTTYHVGPDGLGLMYAAPGAGALLGAAVSGWVGGVRRQGLAVVVSVVAWGAAIAAFGLVPREWFPLALVLLAAAGWADVVSAVFRNTILQLVAPDAMRGRLSALHIAVVTSGPRVGDVEAGTVAALTSVRFSVVSGGLACIAGVALMHAITPVLARYRAPHAT